MPTQRELAKQSVEEKLDQLVRELCRVDQHEAIIRRRSFLNWAALRMDDPLLEQVLKYDEEFGKTPPSLGDLQNYLRSRLISPAMPDDVYDRLKELETAPVESNDVDFLMTEFIRDKTTEFYLIGQENGRTILGNGYKTSKRLWFGPKDYLEYMRKWWNTAPPEDFTQVAGLLDENTGLVGQSLVDKLQPADGTSRVKTGFDKIDNNVVIGPKALRYVGLAGMSGDGKTMLLNTLVYNFALTGKNVLYVSIEHDPQELWEFMTFLHCGYFKHEFSIPSLDNWNLGQDATPPITQEDVNNIASVLDDIKNQRGLPGKIDCQQLLTWNGIVDHIHANPLLSKLAANTLP